MLTEEFVGKLRMSIQDKIVLKDFFTTFAATKAQWALAKYQTKDIIPTFNLDVANPIISRERIAKVPQISHQVYNEFTKELIAKKKVSTAQNLSTQLYAHASVGYHSQEFFE